MSKGFPPSSRSPRAVVAREAIFDAALAVFSIAGFDGATTRAIASRANLAQGHLVYYFPSKESLWRELIQKFEVQLDAVLSATCSDQKVDGALIETLQQVVWFFGRNAAFTKLVLQQFPVHSEREEWLAERVTQKIWARLEPLFTRVAAGRPNRAEPLLLYLSFLGATLFAFGSSLSPEPDVDVFIALHMEVLGLEGLCQTNCTFHH